MVGNLVPDDVAPPADHTTDRDVLGPTTVPHECRQGVRHEARITAVCPG